MVPTQLAEQKSFQFLDLKAQWSPIRDQIMSAVTRVLESQHFILGPEVSAFEQEAANYLGCKYAVGCASGSDALMLALMALGIGRGDEVITVPFTFVATAGSIARLGATPVFVDIDGDTYNIDPATLEAAITVRTKAIMPVHLFGLSSEMDRILEVARRHGLPVIEDAAQAIGAEYKGKKVGNFGVISCFSFFPSKNLGGAGDGGLITTDDAQLAQRLKLLRAHGSRSKYEYEILGVNSRLDAIQAAILRIKLTYLDEWTEGRRRNALRYRELVSEFGLDSRIKFPVEPVGYKHVYNQFTIRAKRRDDLREFLRTNGIPTEIYYPFPLHLQPAFASLGYKPRSMPSSEAASAEVLSLPIFPELSSEQQESVMSSISEFCER
jgi:dTDP-4-amino-4,6-dideoxygalactose transaminase